ncbi:hypothetical protein D3C81_1321440 [compost metagenome]
MALQRADGTGGQLRQQLGEHAMVVGGLEGVGADQPATAGLLERVFEFGEAVGRIDVDQHHAGLGTGELGDGPLGAVRRPDAEALARLQAEGDEGAGTAVDRRGQLGPGETQALVAHHQRLALGETADRLIEGGADGHGQQRLVLSAAGVAWKVHGVPRSCAFYEVCQGKILRLPRRLGERTVLPGGFTATPGGCRSTANPVESTTGSPCAALRGSGALACGMAPPACRRTATPVAAAGRKAQQYLTAQDGLSDGPGPPLAAGAGSALQRSETRPARPIQLGPRAERPRGPGRLT